MNVTIEQFRNDYIEFKRNVLLDNDIKILNTLTDSINRFAKITDKNELIQIESDIATLGYNLSAILGRLIGQYNTEKKIIDKKIFQRKKELEEQGIKTISGRQEIVDYEFNDESRNLSVFEGVIEEYKDKLYAINHVLSAIGHRMATKYQ